MVAHGIVVVRRGQASGRRGAKTYDGHDLGLDELRQGNELKEEGKVELQSNKTASVSRKWLQPVRPS